MPVYASDDAANRDLARILSARTGARVELIGTGGGCDALEVTSPARPGSHLLIVAAGDAAAPLDSEGSWLGGVAVFAYVDGSDEPSGDALLDAAPWDPRCDALLADGDAVVAALASVVGRWARGVVAAGSGLSS